MQTNTNLNKKPFSPRLSLLLAFILGGLYPLGLAPFDLWWLSLISMAYFPLILGRRGFFAGWAYGAGVYIAGVSWVYVSLANNTTAGVIPSALATGILGIMLGLFFALLGLVHQLLPSNYKNLLTTAALWVGLEWLRSWLFTGFPWLYLGYSALESPFFQHWIPIVGIYGCSFLMAVWALSFVKILQSVWFKSAKHKSCAPQNLAFNFVIILAIPVLNFAFGSHAWITPLDESLNIALIQGNIDQKDKWNPINAPKIESLHLQQTALALNDGVDLVIWPEATVPHLYSFGQKSLEEIRDLLSQAPQDPAFITGILTDDQALQIPQAISLKQKQLLTQQNMSKPYKPVLRNSVLLLDQEPQRDRFYHKQKLVPFGEYLPFADQLVAIMPFLSAFQHGISKGSSNQIPFYTKGWHIQPLICYEIAFPTLAFKQIKLHQKSRATISEQGLVDTILTVSNDGWFGMSHGPSQHFQMARFRAVEFGRPVIRATNTGITGIIDAKGHVLARAPRQEQASLIYRLNKVTGQTPYSKIGPNSILWGIMFLGIAGVLAKRNLTKRK